MLAAVKTDRDRAEAAFYLGAKALMAGVRQEARDHLARALTPEEHLLYEQRAARALLQRLDQEAGRR
ncbi:MAG: hypothetical protein AB1634_18455 [Thermodesulfobacteriota bacterium]